MADIDIVSSAKGLFGGFQLSNIWTMLSYGLLILVVVGVVTFFVYRKLQDKKFNKTITFWRRNPYSGKLVADKNIKAMTVRLDNYGNLGYRLKTPYETKNLLSKLKIEAKPNVHYVEYCSDGRIVEFSGIDDYDDQRKSMKASFTDSNTELGRSSMQQMNKERYEKTSWLKEHASLLVNIGAIVVIMVFLWLIADKLITIVNSVANIVNQAGELQEAQNNILNSLNNLLKGTNLLNNGA
jgi:roadblock/LC7 domain-containing protein